MMMRVLALAVVMLCGMGLPAAGEAYLGASYMETTAELDSSSSDDSSSGWKIFGGFEPIRFFGVEATYYDLGSFSSALTSNTTISGDINVYDLSGRGIIPLGEKFQLFARLGYSYVDADVRTTGPVVTASASGQDWELLYGVGVALKLGKSLGIRAEWESWDVETSLDAWSIGAYFRFGGR